MKNNKSYITKYISTVLEQYSNNNNTTTIIIIIIIIMIPPIPLKLAIQLHLKALESVPQKTIFWSVRFNGIRWEV
jgi:hypothetical protein